ncbi:MAG: IS4 family transposase, partial [Flavobacteriaceae bacterium]|nr:IS4 family transposase [Flavobacteriaceae bacterium]
GSGSESTLRIQFEYDLKSSEILDLSLFAYVNQDATNAKETIDRVNSNELIIRDLAYVSIPIMRKIEEKEAFYLNRMQTSVTVFEKINNKFVEIDFTKLHKKMKILHLSILEKEVYIGKKEKFKSRMIVETLSTQQYNERIRKAEKTAKRKGRTVSDSYKAKAALNIFITNTNIVAKNIRVLYTLRWQIELMFKIWKSIGEIDKIKKMKIERFESFLLAKLIWIVLNWQIMRLSVIYFFKEKQLEISPYKLFKTLKSSILDFRKALSESVSSFILFIHENMELCPSNHLSEKKKKTTTWSYDIYRLFKII